MGGAFLAAAVLARVGGRIGLPTIPLFILAGILLGPHTPGIVLVADPHDLEMLSALGLVLLLFYLGLEFHLDDLKAGGRKMALAGGTYLALNVGAGLGFGFALGWGTSEALVLAGVLGISSSAIVTKVLVDLGRIGNPETKPILGIIVVEDVFLALYLAALQPILSGADDLAAAVVDGGKAFGFLLLLALVARFGTKAIGKVINTGDDELLVISFLGAAVFVAGVSEWFGVADAIGAFMVGLMLGSTTSGARILKLVHPLRDAFGAIFFLRVRTLDQPGRSAERALAGAGRRRGDARHERVRRDGHRQGVRLRPEGHREHLHHAAGPRRVRAHPRHDGRGRGAGRTALPVHRRLCPGSRRPRATGRRAVPLAGPDPAGVLSGTGALRVRTSVSRTRRAAVAPRSGGGPTSLDGSPVRGGDKRFSGGGTGAAAPGRR